MTLAGKRWLKSYGDEGPVSLFCASVFLLKMNVRKGTENTVKAALAFTLCEQCTVIALTLLAKKI